MYDLFISCMISSYLVWYPHICMISSYYWYYVWYLHIMYDLFIICMTSSYYVWSLHNIYDIFILCMISTYTWYLHIMYDLFMFSPLYIIILLSIMCSFKKHQNGQPLNCTLLCELNFGVMWSFISPQNWKYPKIEKKKASNEKKMTSKRMTSKRNLT